VSHMCANIYTRLWRGCFQRHPLLVVLPILHATIMVVLVVWL
jgi:hypothetical protein